MNIFVGNLSFGSSETDLKKLFEDFGNVASVAIVMSKEKKKPKSRGFGFVEMPVEQQAFVAIGALNGKEFMGRLLNVSPARPKTETHQENKPERKAPLHKPWKRPSGDAKPWRRTSGDAKPWKRPAGDVKPWKKPAGDDAKPWRRPVGDAKPWRRTSGDAKPWKRPAGDAKPWKKPAGEAKPWKKRPAGDAKPWSKSSERPKKPRFVGRRKLNDWAGKGKVAAGADGAPGSARRRYR